MKQKNSLLSKLTMVSTTSFMLLFLAMTSIVAVSGQDTTCSWDGQIFQRGESLGGSFITRCGSFIDFPCYCNPDINPPIECPYCAYVEENGTDLLCAGDGEITTYVDQTGITQTCECSAPGNGIPPTTNCEDLPDNNNPDDGDDDNDDSTTCTIDLPDGTTQIFQDGASVEDFLPNRCGSTFPCYCNPNIEGQIECPYCRFASLGGDLACARDGETVSFQDMAGITQTCSCQIPQEEENTEPIINCNIDDDNNNNNPTPTPPPSLPTGSQTEICRLELPSGQSVTFRNGESYGDYLPPTRCGATDEFPCFCNPELPNQIECPYCGFVHGDNDEEFTCSKDGEQISLEEGKTCTCEIPDDPFIEPIQNCYDEEDGSGVDPSPPTSAPTTIPTTPSTKPVSPPTDNGNVCTMLNKNGDIIVIPHGERFNADEVKGACGPAEEWPAFCSVDPASDDSDSGSSIISKRAIVRSRVSSKSTTVDGILIDGNILYPYCVFDDTQDNDEVCARNGGDVTYINNEGIEVKCNCLHLSASLGGAQSSCRPTGTNNDSPSEDDADDNDNNLPSESGDRPEEPEAESSTHSLLLQLSSIWSTSIIITAGAGAIALML